MAEFGPGAIRGIVPPMTTPFSATGAVDEAAFRAEARFLPGAGVHGPAQGDCRRPRAPAAVNGAVPVTARPT